MEECTDSWAEWRWRPEALSEEACFEAAAYPDAGNAWQDHVNVKDIRPMTDRDYTVRGCAARCRRQRSMGIGEFPQQAENRFRVTKALLAEE